MGSLLLYLFKNSFQKATAIIEHAPGKSFLFGLLYFIGMPILIILCFITIIGIPLGFLAGAVYVFGFIFVNAFTLAIFSELINTVWSTKITKTWQKWGIFLLLAILLTILNGVGFLLSFFTFGALVLLIGKSFAEAHNKA